jgi:hypothetical protein
MNVVPAEALRAFIAAAFEKVGMPAADASTVAALMTDADLHGADGHGVFRLPQYIRRIRAGGVNLNPDIRVFKERAGMALVNGDNGMGHLVMKRAAEVAIEKARTAGVAWVGAQWSNHAGPASLYARMPLAADMIGLYLAVGNANHLPPWGGIEMLLSTNPIAAAIPAGEEPPLVLDMATTVTAYGKIIAAAQALDGVFLACRRQVARDLGFDAEVFDGWHGYDFDFSFRAHLAGYRCTIAGDLLLVHDSSGNFNSPEWRRSAERVLAKHRQALPPGCALPEQPQLCSVDVASADEWRALSAELSQQFLD